MGITSVLLRVAPKWCELIASGEKTVEIRKTKSNLELPFRVYIYRPSQDGNKGEVIGEFICDGFYHIGKFQPSDGTPCEDDISSVLKQACMSEAEASQYLGEKGGYGWHISNLEIYAQPKDLDEFAVTDEEAVKECEFRKRAYNNPAFTNGALLLGGYYCSKHNDWCLDCKTKPLENPPQNWRYVEEIMED